MTGESRAGAPLRARWMHSRAEMPCLADVYRTKSGWSAVALVHGNLSWVVRRRVVRVSIMRLWAGERRVAVRVARYSSCGPMERAHLAHTMRGGVQRNPPGTRGRSHVPSAQHGIDDCPQRPHVALVEVEVVRADAVVKQLGRHVRDCGRGQNEGVGVSDRSQPSSERMYVLG